jgi:hypothetical protein
MAISKSFGGRNINVPGAYSTSKVDNSNGSAIESNDTIFIIGESTKGAPGDVEGIQEFTNAQISTLIAKYGAGPIVDVALAASRPSLTPGIGGAGRYLVWKTNSTTQASITLNSLMTIKDIAQGAEGNDLSVTIADGDSADQKLISIKKLNDTTESLGQNAGQIAISVQYTGDASTAVLAIAGASQSAKSLSITLAGDQTDGSVDLSIALKDYSLKTLVDFISAQTGYSASLVTSSLAAKRGTELDAVSGLNASAAVSLKRLQQEILEVINSSARVEASIEDVPVEGILSNVADAFLTGGAQGASSNQDFSDGLAQSLAEDYNIVVPAVSRDAADDIADPRRFSTDASSTYTISSINSATESHLRLRSDVESRKEAQGVVSIRKQNKADVYAEAALLGSELVQLMFQDVLVVNEIGSLEWQMPHIKAAMAAGIRLGTEVGEPLTHKRTAARSVGHFVNPETGRQSGDFNSDLDKVEAINQGVTFSEKSGSIFRIVVDNTTYGTDDSFVFNRGSVMEASQFVAKDIRKVAEEVFIGKKLPNERISGEAVSNGAARSIKEVIGNRLKELNAPDVNILSSSVDAPFGYVEETFIVEVEGNTARVQVEVKPVQGLDFIFISFTLGDITQSA